MNAEESRYLKSLYMTFIDKKNEKGMHKSKTKINNIKKKFKDLLLKHE